VDDGYHKLNTSLIYEQRFIYIIIWFSNLRQEKCRGQVVRAFTTGAEGFGFKSRMFQKLSSVMGARFFRVGKVNMVRKRGGVPPQLG